MKPTQRTDAIRNIFKKKVSFLSIVLIVMLGVGGFFATFFMVRGLEEKGEAFYDRHMFKDFEIDASEGIAPEDIETIGRTEGVEVAEGVQIVDASLRIGEERKSVDLLSLTKKVSIPEVIKGRGPREKNECMITDDMSSEIGISTGDTVRIQISDARLPEGLLTSSAFTVTGIMHHPEYLRKGISAAVVVPEASFDKKKTNGSYRSAFVRIKKQTDASMFSDEYFEDTRQVRIDLETVAGLIRQKRAKTIREEVNKELDKGNKQLEKAREELDAGLLEAETKLKNAEAQLKTKEAQGRSELEDGEEKLRKAKKELDKSRASIEEGEKELKEAKIALKEALKELDGLKPEQMIDIMTEAEDISDEVKEAILSGDQARIAAATARAEAFVKRKDVQKAAFILAKRMSTKASVILDHILNGTLPDWMRTTFDEYIQQLQLVAEGPKYIASAEKELSKSKKKLAAKESDYNDGLAALEKGKSDYYSQLKKGREQIAAGWARYYQEKKEKEEELEKAWEKYLKEKEDSQEILRNTEKEETAKEGYVVVRDRLSNGGYVDFRSNIRAIESSGWVFGIGFLVLCAMVCFSTLALIIEEQKQLVGTSKAFGLYPSEILKKYLSFGVTAAFAGSVLGIPLGVVLGNFALAMIEKNHLYIVTGIRSVVTLIPAILVIVIAMVLCAAVTVVACRGLLRTSASRLMKGEIQKSRDKKGGLFRKPAKSRRAAPGGSLYSRLIVRNMKDDLARVILTITILAGSCFIIGLGFTVRESLTGMLDAQQNDILKYDTRIELGNSITGKQKSEIKQYLDDKGVRWTEGTYEPHLYRTDGRTEALYVLCADPKVIGNIYSLRDPKTQDKIRLPRRGILIQNRLHETAGFSEGDSIRLYGLDLSPRKGEIAGQFQNYEGRLILMSEETYRITFLREPSKNSIYLQYGGKNDHEKERILDGLGAVSEDIAFENSDAFAERFESLIGIFNIVVMLMIGIAILMSFMILMNLTNIFVNRKKKEIIVMRINGFSRHQTDGYLIRETVFMTLTGLLVAFVAGMLTTEAFVRVLEQPDVQSIRTPSPVLWGAGVLIEAFFAVIISYIAFRKTRKYQLREISES